MSIKERLHQLIDEMNDDQANVLLIELEDESPPLSEAERRDIDLARRQLREGQGIPHDEVMRRLRAAQ